MESPRTSNIRFSWDMGGDSFSCVEADLVVIGSGLYGIQAARTYLEVHPNRIVVILEAGTSVGGVWSSDRMYDAFWTQTPLDIAEFSDRPMGVVPLTDQYYRFFAAKHVTRYLDDYVDDHIYNGFSLRSRITFESRVEKLEKVGAFWIINIRDRKQTYKTPRIIDASGLTSSPRVPDIEGMDLFTGHLIHHKHFGRADILSNDQVNDVVVVGGAKSAADVAYAAAKAGKKVSWIIRESGSGPGAFFSAKGKALYRNSNESFYTRMTSYWLASIFAVVPWWLRKLYDTKPGQRLFIKFWNDVNESCLTGANYARPDGKERGFSNLKPVRPVFWQNDSSSVNNRDDFFDTIAQKVTVYRDDISSMNENQEILLAKGTSIPADAIIFATGWSNRHSYLSTETKAKLGIPHKASEVHSEEADTFWQYLDQEAESYVRYQFPLLVEQPKLRANADVDDENDEDTPYRLYNAMLPIADHSILFVGHIMLGNHFRASEVQALWAVAFFDGNISLPPRNSMRLSVAKTVQWCRLRYLDKGQSGNWFYYDLIPYTDMLLRDIGLQSHSKPGWKALVEPCWAKDLRDLISEYKTRFTWSGNGK